MQLDIHLLHAKGKTKLIKWIPQIAYAKPSTKLYIWLFAFDSVVLFFLFFVCVTHMTVSQNQKIKTRNYILVSFYLFSTKKEKETVDILV